VRSPPGVSRRARGRAGLDSRLLIYIAYRPVSNAANSSPWTCGTKPSRFSLPPPDLGQSLAFSLLQNVSYWQNYLPSPAGPGQAMDVRAEASPGLVLYASV
jgi:hypothetical protein